ncbi:MAG: xylose isomerase [Ruminococcaceae bacterium]|nr:xylose isomerase [Oscillospiraceae bacterium]
MIKRGVSLYSYQQNEFFGWMDWKAQLREVATNLDGATGIEIINETTVPDYPMPPESFYFEWNNEMARWGLTAVTMDTFIDTLQFRDHVMTYAECAERIKYDLRIAKRMGFKNMRLSHHTPWQAVEIALPLAEELDIVMTNECDVRSLDLGYMMGDSIESEIAFIERTGTKHYGLQTDMSQFQNKPSCIRMRYQLRNAGYSPEAAYDAAEDLFNKFVELGQEGAEAYAREKYPEIMAGRWGPFHMHANPVGRMYEIIPYLVHMHGKFYEMTEIPGKPGQYEDRSLPYEEVIKHLKKSGWNGYIHSEFEGQRSQQDMGLEGLIDEVEQVRRHHEMLKRLINDKNDNTGR